MVAVDHGRPQVGAYNVELVAKVRHLVCTVFITGNNLINRIDNDRDVVFFGCPTNELWRQPVHRHALSSQVPDIDIIKVCRFNVHGLIYILETMQTARPVKLQINVHHLAFCTIPPQPLLALCDRYAKLDKRIRLSSLRRTCKQHLMPLPKHAVNKWRRKRRQIIPCIKETLWIRKIVIYALDPFLPLVPVFFSNISLHKELLPAVSNDPRHPGKPRRIPVLTIYFQPVLSADFVKIIDTLSVLFVASGIHFYDGMQTLLAAVDKTRNWKFQLSDDGILLFDLHIVGLDQGKTVISNVLIFHAAPIQRIEPDPCTGSFLIVADHRSYIILIFSKQFDQLSSGPVIRSLAWEILSVLFPAAGHISNVLIAIKKRFQIFDQFTSRIPFVSRLMDLFSFKPFFFDNDQLILGADLGVPVKLHPRIRLPASILCHLHDSAGSNPGSGHPMEAVPFFLTLSIMVAFPVSSAPAVPVSCRITVFF